MCPETNVIELTIGGCGPYDPGCYLRGKGGSRRRADILGWGLGKQKDNIVDVAKR